MAQIRTLERRAGRLPAELTSFVGRRGELAEIKRLFGRCRLVTLMGPGGVGKTRLAVRVAGEMGPSFAAGVCFVDLAPLREPGLLAETICERLGLPDQGTGAAVDTLAEHLADRHLLLVLDTCEHLVEACAMLAEVLLPAAAGLRILATSRQAFDLAGEHTLMVAPLPSAPLDLADTQRPCESVELFAERAAAVQSSWTLDPANHATVAALCHRLDGIPLAIELAAVHLRALSVEQILARLDDRILHVQGRRTSMSRHQTLRTAVDWSYDLCSPSERLLWERLSVFAGDFGLEAAERVCTDDELPADRILELLSGLVAKSIVLRTDHRTARYRMLDTIRQYGAERLEQLGQTATMMAQAIDFYVPMLDRIRADAATGAQPDLLAWFRLEQPNVRALLDHGLRTLDDDLMVRVGLALALAWAMLGRLGEARYWADRIRAERDASGPQWAELLALIAFVRVLQNEPAPARELLTRVESMAPGDRSVLAYVIEIRGVAALYDNDLDSAVRLLSAGCDQHRRLGNTEPLAQIGEVFLAAITILVGDPAAAAEQAAETARACERRGEQWCRSYAMTIQACATWLGGDPAAALPIARDALRIKRDLDDVLGLSFTFEAMAGCQITLGDAKQAAHLLGAADRVRQFTGMSLFGPPHAMLRVVYEQQTREALGEAAYEVAYTQAAAQDSATTLAELLDDPVPADDPTEAGPPAHPLTRRELEIAELVAEGLSNREIAERLFIAKRTVDSHLEHILTKLDFTSRTQIATWIARQA